MPTPRLIGHPDFLPVNGVPMPVLCEQFGPFPAGSWGPVTINTTSGGTWLLALTCNTTGDIVLSDVTVTHYDAAGNVVFTDSFGAVIAGNTNNTVFAALEPTVLRGNIYGPTITISGIVASSAYVNTVLGSSGQFAGELLINAYTLPAGLGDPDPKMSNGSFQVSTITGNYPGNFLAGFSALNLAGATSGVVTPLSPYTGPAYMMIRNTTGSAVPNDAQMPLKFYTVANGTTPFQNDIYEASTANFPYAFNLNIPACLATWQCVNVNAATAVVFYGSIVGAKAA